MTTPYEDELARMISERKTARSKAKTVKEAKRIDEEIAILERELTTYQKAMSVFRHKKQAQPQAAHQA